MPNIADPTFQEIFRSSVEAIIVVDESGTILIANPASETMFAYAEGELPGLLVENLIPEKLRAKHVSYRAGFHKHPEPRAMGHGRDLVAKKKDGSEFPVEVSLSFTRINNQLLVIAFVNDISIRKKAEKALKDSEEQLLVYAGELEKKVMARTQDLNSTVQKLERANAFLQEQIQERQRAEEEARKALERERELNDLKSKFVSIASHEFRTPLSTVLSSASLVSQYHVRGEQEKVEKHVHRIKASVNHLTGILNDFLSLGKLEEGKVDLVKEDIDLSAYLQEIFEELRPQLKEGQSLSLDLDPTISTIVTDSRILRNILFNLISNASKYSDEHKSIKCRTRNLTGSLTIAVEDQGMGIPEEEQKHMFERFYRASNATNIQGSGLGLNIVKRYLELLNGTITFASSYGRGSTFIITIPTH